MDYAFRRAEETDLHLLRAWRALPHVSRWWGPPGVEDPAETFADRRVAMWMVALAAAGTRLAKPFAYIQDYRPHDWTGHPFAYLPAGARGIDHFIGEPGLIGIGHGSAFIRLHCDRLFAEGAPAIGTDPHPDNVRAIRACEKAGFVRTSDPLDTRWGRAVLMERRR